MFVKEDQGLIGICIHWISLVQVGACTVDRYVNKTACVDRTISYPSDGG